MSAEGRRADLPLIRRLLRPGPGVRILDLGGGTGGFATVLAGDGAEVVVLEPNPKKVAFGRSRFPDVTFVEGDGESIPFRDGSFHRSMAMLSFHHLEDPDKV